MPRNDSGTMALTGTFAIANTIAPSATVNGYIDDITGEISKSLSRDGQGSMRADLEMGSHKIIDLLPGTASTDAVNFSELTVASQSGISSMATAVAGTADAITATFSPAFTAYTANTRFWFKATGPNTITAPTINLDSLGVKTIKRQGGIALAPYDIPYAGYICECFYDGTDVIFLNRDPTPTGQVSDFAGSVAPPGYLICNGNWVNRTTYAALFAVIGTIYGAGDASNFPLPNCTGRVSVGLGMAYGGQWYTWALGSQVGSDFHTLTWGQMPVHAHNFTAAFESGARNVESGSNHLNQTTQTQSTQNAGNNEAHNNVQPSIGLNKIIKT